MAANVADVDVNTLSRYEAAEFRRELIWAIEHPGIEYDVAGPEYERDRKAYHDKVKELDVYLATFPDR